MQQEQQNQFKVAPIISNDKQTQFIHEVIQTILGMSKQITQSPITVGWAIALPIITYLIPMVVDSIYLAIIIPSAVNVVINIIVEVTTKKEAINGKEIFIKNTIFAAYCILWTHHMFVLKQYHQNQAYLFILSAVAIITSIETVALESVKQFGGHSVENSILGFESTAFMRYFMAFPTLFAQICIYNSPNINVLSTNLYPLRLASSLIFITWWFGWFSSIKNTLYFVLNKITTIILGDQTQYNWKNAFKSIITNLIPIAIYEIIYYRTDSTSLNPLIIGPTITSIITFIKNNIVHKQINLNNTNQRPLLCIIYEIAICGLLVALANTNTLQNISLSIFVAIDIGIYFGFNIVKELCKGWSSFGLNVHCQAIRYNSVVQIQRMLLRFFSAASVLIIIKYNLTTVVTQFSYSQNIIVYIIIPILGYRSFKRCISETNSFSLHLSLLICLICINTNNFASGCLVVLMMPPFPHNSYQTIVSIFQIPPKAKHKNQCLYQIFYVLGTVFGLCIHFLSLGTFQLTMLFGLPLYLPSFPTQTQGYQVKSAQNSLYEKIIQNINPSLFRFYQNGYYLLRIEKYIILMEIKSTCYGFCQLIDFRGLEVQEVTSCHSKQGESIDKMVEQTWGDNKVTCSLSPYFYAITPLTNQKLYVPTQNDIQLTGVIESKEFVALFKQTALKSIVRQYSKIVLTENQKRQAEVIMGEISAFYKKDAADKIFPLEFAKKYNVKAAYPITSTKVKLPPISKKGTKKNQVLNDFLDLLQNSNQPLEPSLTGLNQKEKDSQSEKKQLKLEQANMAIILTLYYYSIGKLDYIMVQKLYKIIKRESETVTQIEFDSFQKILSIALATAFKISIDKYINGEFQVDIQDFDQYDKNCFLGTSDSQQFKNAILNDKQDIWTINYAKKSLAIKRMAKSSTNMYVFQASQVILKSVWNNLRFQLVFATNDNDERYSIQTHPNILRNLWVQACQQPFGYPSFHSGLMINK